MAKFISQKNDAVIDLILRDRGEIGVTNISYLKSYLKKNPQMADKILISKKLDQTYKHSILISKKSQIDLDWFQELINKVKRSGELETVLEPFGVKVIQ